MNYFLLNLTHAELFLPWLASITLSIKSLKRYLSIISKIHYKLKLPWHACYVLGKGWGMTKITIETDARLLQQVIAGNAHDLARNAVLFREIKSFTC
jgi:hypothetical protein